MPWAIICCGPDRQPKPIETHLLPVVAAPSFGRSVQRDLARAGDEFPPLNPTHQVQRFFSFLYLKKIKFQKYMPNKEIFCRPCNWRQDLNIKKLYLGPGAQGALNSELLKSI